MFKKWGWSVAAVFIGGFAIALELMAFSINSFNSLEQFIHRNMEEMNKTAISSMNYSFQNFVGTLEQQATIMGTIVNPTSAEIMQSLNTFAEDKRFERVTLVTPYQKAYSSEYGIVDMPENYKVANMNKEYSTIAEPRITDDGEMVIDIGTPAYINGERVGRLVASVGQEELHAMYIANSLQGDAALTLITSDGMIILHVGERDMELGITANVFDYQIDKDIIFMINTPEDVKADIANGRAGWMKYIYDGHTMCINYQPFGINNWYMGVSATEYTLETQAADIRMHANILTISILLTVLFVAAVIMIQRIKEQERMDALKNTYSVAIRKTNDLFYEADIDSDQLIDRSEDNTKAIWKEAPKNYSDALEQISKICAPECKQQFLDTMLPQNIRIKVKQGISSINLDYKIIPDANTVRWLSATFVPVVDKTNNSTRLICMENDITEQMLKQERLRRSATRDGLTGLYNKMTTQGYIDDFLEGEGAGGKHALLVIDIDKFKSINDTLGHAKGDEVIGECGNTLRCIFRKNDIVGRIGGDEFAVLIKDYGTEELIATKAQEICDGFRKKNFLADDPKTVVPTSASIGIALYEENGKTFDELYKCADIVLYRSKESGRDRYTFAEHTAADNGLSKKVD